MWRPFLEPPLFYELHLSGWKGDGVKTLNTGIFVIKRL